MSYIALMKQIFKHEGVLDASDEVVQVIIVDVEGGLKNIFK